MVSSVFKDTQLNEIWKAMNYIKEEFNNGRNADDSPFCNPGSKHSASQIQSSVDSLNNQMHPGETKPSELEDRPTRNKLE